MDLNDYWQENKRFVTTVCAGLVVFLVGYFILNAHYQTDIKDTDRRISSLRTDLRKPMFTSSNLSTAKEENEALLAAVATLEEATAFRPREEFVLDASLGSFPNQYLRALTRVREDLLPRANRGNMTIEAGLGMPKLSPTKDEEIVRYLEALDVIETVATAAIDARVKRLDKITIRLDTGLNSKAGLGRIERTRVHFEMRGTSLALTRLVSSTQRPRDGRVLHIDEIEMSPSRSKDDEVQLDLTLTIARLRPLETAEG